MIRTLPKPATIRLKVPRPGRRRSSSLGDIGPGYGQCGLTSTPGWCQLPYDPPGTLTPCSQIRECDQYTGAAHFEYALPGGPSGNADINVYDPAKGTFSYVGADGKTAAQSPFQIAYDPATGTARNLTQAAPVLPYVAPASAAPASGSGAPPANATTYHPTITFENLSTGDASHFAVNDRWKITITGAQPGSVVKVAGGKGGAMDVTPFGQADAQGNWTLTGAMSANEIGDWYEKWTAADQVAGELRFTVAAAPSKSNNSGANSNSGDSGHDLASSNGSDLIEKVKSLPWYVWAGGAAALLVMGRRK